MEEEIKLLLQEIEKYPEDWDRYLVLADAYEEMGDERRAKGCRWICKKKKRPYEHNPTNWHWYDIRRVGRTPSIDPESDLPANIFNNLSAELADTDPAYKQYSSFQEAILDFLEVWWKHRNK